MQKKDCIRHMDVSVNWGSPFCRCPSNQSATILGATIGPQVSGSSYIIPEKKASLIQGWSAFRHGRLQCFWALEPKTETRVWAVG